VTDPRHASLAKLLTGYSVEVQPGQTVAIIGGVAAEPLHRAVYREVVARGGYPVVIPSYPDLGVELLTHGSDDQLRFITPVERFLREQTDVSISILADTNTKAASGVDPARQTLMQRARTELFERFLARDASGELQWTLTLFPTDAYAQDAGMSTPDFAEFVFRACKLHEPDPIAAWRKVYEDQERIVAWLAGKSEIRLTGPGTDLTVGVAGRTWINAHGKHNFPDGEIFTGPVETSANGHVRFSFPVVTAGREIEDVRLVFRDGKAVEATAARNEDYLVQTLDTDPGARYLGEFAIGTNFDITRFIKNILFDEKIGGTVHLALGAGYAPTGSSNKSAIHWDMICDLRDGGQIDVDGLPFLRDGRIVI
jgi:aminopeptidase